MIPSVNILKEKSELYTIKLEINGSDYYITITARNAKGQNKIIDGKNFRRLEFESFYQNPFMSGQLQLSNVEQKTYFSNTASKKIYDYDMLGSGGEFLNIKVEIPNPGKLHRKITILNENYVVKDVRVNKVGDKQVLNYCFINLNFGALFNTRLPWSTNMYVPNSIYKNSFEKQMLVSEAIKQLLIKTHGDKNVIDEKHWEESVSTIEYTLKNNQAPIVGLHHLLSKYISKNKDLGILTQNGGLYQLKSLKTLFKEGLKTNFGGAIIIQTENHSTTYNKKQATKFFSTRYGQNMIPTSLSNVTFLPRQSDIEIDTMVDHNVAGYNISSKQFNIYSSQGTLENLKGYLPSYMDTFPDAENRDVPIDDSVITKPNKHVSFELDSTENEHEYIGKIRVQEKLIRTAEKIIFNIPGNLYIKGSNFIGIEITGPLLNQKMKDLQGMAFVVQNKTVFTPTTFVTELVCSKLDKEKI